MITKALRRPTRRKVTVDDVVKKYEAKELTAARAGAQLGLGLEDFKVNILSLCKGHWL